MCPAVDHLVMHQAPVEIREHHLCLRRHGCSHVVLAYEFCLGPSRLSNHIRVMKSAWCSRLRRPRWGRAR